ncbi:hypothetical protein PR202_ga15027 [Eleusine coracana subsp. coracana]|uniref:Cation-transporting P-type ATPase C-terminal domain-containing protein n=1 Tax=Eleusine coracana subsp. coracana TaxID=191504 RepID=A0AAV5CIY2_ELECO|nr:hypothetical protein PR202_ga15027 [Eleusine coracana subsp. coracana]
MFLGIIAVTIAMQVLMVELLTRFAGTQRLTLAQWGVCVAIAAVSWPIGWAVKFIPVPKRTLHQILTTWRNSCFSSSASYKGLELDSHTTN